MTLTTEQLRARAKFWREKAVEAKWESVSIAQDMLQNADAFDELAANREAQPVIVVGDDGGDALAYRRLIQSFAPGTKLYTAPPAPAVPEGFKLMPIEITDEIAEAIAMEARCCGGIALCIYEAALAAAPEGGN
ncbi:hypothetical protein [Serratia sp. (in: enterobacteria)]|uniref:hypothetical protein n=1 Tax=Serratia sp. (in: enterobacteria) TaxID=616 RepID=UPI004037693A